MVVLHNSIKLTYQSFLGPLVLPLIKDTPLIMTVSYAPELEAKEFVAWVILIFPKSQCFIELCLNWCNWLLYSLVNIYGHVGGQNNEIRMYIFSVIPHLVPNSQMWPNSKKNKGAWWLVHLLRRHVFHVFHMCYSPFKI